MRAAARASMTETALIRRRVQVSDGAGGQTVTLQTVATVPVLRLAEVAGAGDTFAAGQAAQGLRWKLLLPAGTDVRDADRVDIGADSYEPTAVAAPGTADAVVIVYALKR